MYDLMHLACLWLLLQAEDSASGILLVMLMEPEAWIYLAVSPV